MNLRIPAILLFLFLAWPVQAQEPDERFAGAIQIFLTQDEAKGIEELEQLAEEGYLDAQIFLGLNYASSLDAPPEDLAKGKIWLQKAADQGDLNSTLMLAILYLDDPSGEPNYTKARELFVKAADQGDPQSQFMLGQMSQTGTGVEIDLVQAAEWFAKGAALNHPASLTALALMQQAGQGGLEPDPEQAYALLKRAGDQGFTEAHFHMANAHRTGTGVEQSNSRAVSLYHKASVRNHTEAQFFLAQAYAAGSGGTRKDNIQVYVWCSFATASEIPEIQEKAQACQTEMEALLSPEQIEQAKMIIQQIAKNFPQIDSYAGP